MILRILAVSLVVTCLFGVGTAAADDFENGRYINGRYINGRYINGQLVNEPSINGVSLGWDNVNGIWLYPPYKNGFVDYAYLWGSKIVAWQNYNYVDDFRGGYLHGWIGENRGGAYTAKWLRVDNQTTAPDDPLLTYYNLSAWGQGDRQKCTSYGYYQYCWMEYGVWDYWPICDGNPAIALQGTWDYREGWKGAGGKESSTGITMACVDGSIGKCVVGGYKPWHSSSEFVGYEYQCESTEYSTEPYCQEVEIWEYNDMDAALQACVRMLRADYCGDGNSHTADGTDIEVGDNLSPRVNTMAARPLMGFEAVWTAAGAICVSDARLYSDYMIDSSGCLCEDGGGVCKASREPMVFPSTPGSNDPTMAPLLPRIQGSVPFTHGNCDLPADTLYNLTETIDPTQAPL